MSAAEILAAGPVPPLVHDVRQAAARLGVSRTTVYTLIRAGELRPVKIQSRTLIPESELVAYVERHTSGPGAA